MKSQDANDFLGQVFGLLTVEGNSTTPALTVDRSQHKWVCICSCGSRIAVRAANVKNGHTKSCGCQKLTSMITHGHTRHGKFTLEYASWAKLIDRSSNPNNPAYANYAGRGVTVCEEFRVFVNFLRIVGNRPSVNHSVDRIDNEGGYSCGNCPQCLENGWPMNVRWATKAEQNRNKRQTRKITFMNKTQCLTDWAREFGLQPSTLTGRLDKQGLSIEQALTKPLRLSANLFHLSLR